MLFSSEGFMLRSAAVDLGTVNTLIALKGQGIVLREPSAVAVRTEDEREIVAVGREALEFSGKTPGGVSVIWPLREGVIADGALAAEMLRRFTSRALRRKNGVLGRRLAMCMPLCVTKIERAALEEAAKAAGAREVLMIDEPVAAAYGADLPASEPRGTLVADIGGGTTDIAVLSLGGIVESVSLRLGGRHIDGAIREYIGKQYGLIIGDRTAEEIKLTLACALPGGMERMQVRGRSVKNGLPASCIVNSGEISHAAAPCLRRIVDGIREVLAVTPPELAADIMTSGITLTGGGAGLPGLAKLVASETGVETSVAESPLDCVALGALALLDAPDVFENARFA